jgi:hypothetical protein
LSKIKSTMKIEYTIEQWLAIRMIETHHNDQHGREMLPLIGCLLCTRWIGLARSSQISTNFLYFVFPCNFLRFQHFKEIISKTLSIFLKKEKYCKKWLQNEFKTHCKPLKNKMKLKVSNIYIIRINCGKKGGLRKQM